MFNELSQIVGTHYENAIDSTYAFSEDRLVNLKRSASMRH
jgi:hypothetical protein